MRCVLHPLGIVVVCKSQVGLDFELMNMGDSGSKRKDLVSPTTD